MQSSYDNRRHARLRTPGRRRGLVLAAYMSLGVAVGGGSVVLDAAIGRNALTRERAQRILFDGDVQAIWLRAGIGLAIGTAAGLLNVCFGREHRR